MKIYIRTIALVLTSIFLVSCEKEKVEAVKERKIKVETSLPVKMRFKNQIKFQGNIEAVQKANICSRIDGAIDKLSVKEGDFIAKNAMLFQIDKVNLENQVEVSKQNLSVTKSVLRRAVVAMAISKVKMEKVTIDLNRAKQLIEKNIISKDSYEKTELVFKQVQAEIELNKANLNHSQVLVEQSESLYKIALKKLNDSIIKSPFDCVIVKKNKEYGEYAKLGDSVLYIENPNKLEVSLLIASEYYSMIEINKTKSEIYDLYNNQLCKAMVTYRSPTIDPLTRTFEIKIALKKSAKLASGMICNVRLILNEKEGYGVPTNSVMLRTNNKHIIFSENNGKAKEIEVTTGLTKGEWTELVDFKKDIPVVIKGQAFLNNGTAIENISNGDSK